MPCENTFHLKAYDLAGNIAEKSVTPDTPEVLEKPEIREENRYTRKRNVDNSNIGNEVLAK